LNIGRRNFAEHHLQKIVVFAVVVAGLADYRSQSHSIVPMAFPVCRIAEHSTGLHCNLHTVGEEAENSRRVPEEAEVVDSHNRRGEVEGRSLEVGSSLAGVNTAGVGVLHILRDGSRQLLGILPFCLDVLW